MNNDWVPTIGKPAFVAPVKQWGIVKQTIYGRFLITLVDGNTVVVPSCELAEEEVIPPVLRTFVDTDGNTAEIGCGVVSGDLMFWIDAKHEQITIPIANREDLLNIIKEVLS